MKSAFTGQRLALLMLVVTSAAVYVPINRAAHGGINLSGSLDSSLPLIPVFAVPYLLILPLFWAMVLYAFIKAQDLTRLLIVLVAVFTLSNLLYLLVPTYTPRPADVTGWLHGLVSYIYSHDKPYCDLPSEHASMAIIFGLYWWTNSKKYRWVTVSFAVSVVLATVFIKQHSIIGALTGAGLGATVWLVVSKYLSGIQLD